jgi:hypothetical protein
MVIKLDETISKLDKMISGSKLGDYKEGFEADDADYRALLQSDSYPGEDLFFLFLGIKPSKKQDYEENLKCMMELECFFAIKWVMEDLGNGAYGSGKSQDDLRKGHEFNIDMNVAICELFNGNGEEREKCLRKWQEHFLPKKIKNMLDKCVEGSKKAIAKAWENRCIDDGFVQELDNFVQKKSLKGRININKQVWKEKLKDFEIFYSDKVEHILNYLLKNDCEEDKQPGSSEKSANKRENLPISFTKDMMICFLADYYLKNEGEAMKEKYKVKKQSPSPCLASILFKEMDSFFSEKTKSPVDRSVREALKDAQTHHPHDDEIFVSLNEIKNSN